VGSLRATEVIGQGGEAMLRRDFIAGIVGAAASPIVWPLVTRAQQRALPVVGVIGPGSAPETAAQVSSFRQGLEQAGFSEGRNVAVEYRWAENQFDRLPIIATEFVRRPVAVIVVLAGTATALAAKAATATIPIVFHVGGDPVRAGLVASLARPGGNLTGVADLTELLITKRFEIIREIVPRSVIGFLLNPDNPNVALRAADIQAIARTIEQPIRIVYASSEAQFEPLFATLAQDHIGGLVIQNDPVFNDRHARLAALAIKYAMPAIMEFRDFVVAGGLVSYGTSDDQSRQIGVYTGRILKGEKAFDLPVMLPTRFELVVNLKTAKAIGLTISESFLVRADEVIE
jgi:putative tryptophan/tyrosine transport system substrate-binding protein